MKQPEGGQDRDRPGNDAGACPLLAIDTATRHAVIGVQRADGARAVGTSLPTTRHGRLLAVAIRDLLRALDLEPPDLRSIAVGNGPGSYTGLRVGLATAQALAYATGAAVVALDSLELLAQGAPADSGRVCVVAEAQRDRLYRAVYGRDAPGAPLRLIEPCRVIAARDWREGLPAAVTVLGPAAARLHRPEDAGPIFLDQAVPDPDRLLDLALQAFASRVPDDLWGLEPRYLQPSAAELKHPRPADESSPTAES